MPPPILESGSKLPISSQVNKESRAETLRHYQKGFGSSSHPFRSYINPELDRLHLLCEYTPLCVQINPEHFNKLKQVAITTSFVSEDTNSVLRFSAFKFAYYKSSTPDPEEVTHRTLGNFLFYVQSRYFPQLRSLDVRFCGTCPHTEDIREEMLHSLKRTLLFRRKDGRGLYIEPITQEGWGYTELSGLRIRFLEKREDTDFPGDCERAAGHEAWLECVGVTLWVIMGPESVLDKNHEFNYRIQQRDHQLL